MTDETTDLQPDPSGAPEGGDPVPILLVGKGELDEVLSELPASEAAWARAHGFAAKAGRHIALPAPDGSLARVLIGRGEGAAHQRFPIGGFAMVAPAGTYRIETALTAEEAEAAALGWLLARYRFERYKSQGPEREADLLVPEGTDGARIGVIAEGVFITRDLINTPANDMGPEALEKACRKLAERHDADISVTTGEDLLAGNFPLIHTVGRASAEAPRLIDLTAGPEDAPRVTLVGKGVCFDTGGLNLKPGGSMGLMKKDMGGAATVLGLAHMILSLGLAIRLRVLIPAVENAVSGASFRPGDILTARNGKTVEINNTDAEGRLVLADALSLAIEERPELLIDMATLTGAARVALGPELAPFFTDDENASPPSFPQAAARVGDPVWRMPLWRGYDAMIEPGIADLDNAPSGGHGGAITAALFLRRFVGDVSWAHFDVFAWTPKPKPGRPKGGEVSGGAGASLCPRGALPCRAMSAPFDRRLTAARDDLAAEQLRGRIERPRYAMPHPHAGHRSGGRTAPLTAEPDDAPGSDDLGTAAWGDASTVL